MTTPFILSAASRAKLKGVHPDLVRVVERAITLTPVDFRVTEGLRTLARQRYMVASGASKTLNSRHLDGYAVDVVALIGGQVCWDWRPYTRIAIAFKQAASELNIPIEWGGDWTFKDGCYYQLPWSHYP